MHTNLSFWLASPNQLDVIITTGRNRYLTKRCDNRSCSPIINKELEGFGELFRYLSYTEDVGTRALLTRAIAGTCDNTLIFALPGSTGAIKLAIEN